MPRLRKIKDDAPGPSAPGPKVVYGTANVDIKIDFGGADDPAPAGPAVNPATGRCAVCDRPADHVHHEIRD